MTHDPVVWQVARDLDAEHFALTEDTRRHLESISHVQARNTRPVAILKMTESRDGQRHVPTAIPVSVLGRLFRLNKLANAFGAPYGTVVIPISLEAHGADSADIALLAGWYQLVVERMNQVCGGGLKVYFDLELQPEMCSLQSPIPSRAEALDKMSLGRDKISAALLLRERKLTPEAALIRMLSLRQAGQKEVTGLFREDGDVLRQPLYGLLVDHLGFVFTPNTYDLAGNPTHETVWAPGQRRIKARANEPIQGMLPSIDEPISPSDYMALRALRALCALGESAIPGIRDEELIVRESELAAACKFDRGTELSARQREHAFICRSLVSETLPRMMGALCPSESEVLERANDAHSMLVA